MFGKRPQSWGYRTGALLGEIETPLRNIFGTAIEYPSWIELHVSTDH
jgi:hypothetical protein